MPENFFGLEQLKGIAMANAIEDQRKKLEVFLMNFSARLAPTDANEFIAGLRAILADLDKELAAVAASI